MPTRLHLIATRLLSGYAFLMNNSKENESMPKVSSKRQITLPVDQCKQVGIEPGDEYQRFVADGHVTIVKKVPGATSRILKNVKGDASVTDRVSWSSGERTGVKGYQVRVGVNAPSNSLSDEPVGGDIALTNANPDWQAQACGRLEVRFQGIGCPKERPRQ